MPQAGGVHAKPHLGISSPRIARRSGALSLPNLWIRNRSRPSTPRADSQALAADISASEFNPSLVAAVTRKAALAKMVCLDEGPPAQEWRPTRSRAHRRSWPRLDEGPPAPGPRRDGEGDIAAVPAPAPMKGPPGQGRRRGGSHRGRPGLCSLDEGRPAQGRRPAGRPWAAGSPKSLDEGPPAQGRRQGANSTASDLAFWCCPRKAARYGC